MSFRVDHQLTAAVVVTQFSRLSIDISHITATMSLNNQSPIDTLNEAVAIVFKELVQRYQKQGDTITYSVSAVPHHLSATRCRVHP
jgi:hypothetical protein